MSAAAARCAVATGDVAPGRGVKEVGGPALPTWVWGRSSASGRRSFFFSARRALGQERGYVREPERADDIGDPSTKSEDRQNAFGHRLLRAPERSNLARAPWQHALAISVRAV
jgi:hypothetical protein